MERPFQEKALYHRHTLTIDVQEALPRWEMRGARHEVYYIIIDRTLTNV
jgi:hypothetical protein